MPQRLNHLLVTILVVVGGARAWGLEPIAILAPDDCDNNDFGNAVAISGDYIAVGAPRDPCYNGDASGAVYVFRRLGPNWIQVAKLTAPDGGWPDQLGYSVAMEGDVVVAGAPRIDWECLCSSGPGAVYVFRRNDNGTPNDPWDDSWPFEAKLVGPKPEQGQILGWSVAISGDVIVAGEPGYGGTAEIFQWRTGAWTHEATLTASNSQLGDKFGASVDIDLDRIVVGAPWYGPHGSSFVFKYESESWAQEQELSPSERVGFFGESVSILGNRAVVGSPYVSRAFIFLRDDSNTWTEQQILKASDLSVGQFGSGVAIFGNQILVGAHGNPWGYVFENQSDSWEEEAKIFGIDGGWAFPVALEKRHAVVVTHVYAVRKRHTLLDYASFQICFGQEVPSSSCVDIEFAILDLREFELFMGTFSGP